MAETGTYYDIFYLLHIKILSYIIEVKIFTEYDNSSSIYTEYQCRKEPVLCQRN
jgi:hypothetical protein